MQAFCKNMFTEFCKGAFDANQTVFVKNVLNRKYFYGIPLKYKLKRIPTMFKNLYKLLVDASYR